MSKVVADNKSPNKSVNRLSYGLFTLRLQNNSSVQDICFTGVSLLTGLSCNLFEVINLWSDMTVYPKIANNSLFKDICLYSCHCFQHYLVIDFEVIDLYIALF